MWVEMNKTLMTIISIYIRQIYNPVYINTRAFLKRLLVHHAKETIQKEVFQNNVLKSATTYPTLHIGEVIWNHQECYRWASENFWNSEVEEMITLGDTSDCSTLFLKPACITPKRAFLLFKIRQFLEGIHQLLRCVLNVDYLGC